MDKLKQQRSNGPEKQESVQTQIRRPSSLAHTAIVRSTVTCSPAPAMPHSVSVTRRPRISVPVNPIDIARLEERVPTPTDIGHEIPGLCRQLRNIYSRALPTQPLRRITHAVPQTIQENVELGKNNLQFNTLPYAPPPLPAERRRRHTVGVPPQGTISVPSDHPLLAGGISNSNSTMYEIVPNPSIIVSPSDRVDFPSADSGFHSSNIGELVEGNSAVSTVSRRFSEGNTSHFVDFHQTRTYCSSSPLRLIQEEHQKLQELHPPSLTHAQLFEQQRMHTVYKEKYVEMGEELKKHYQTAVQQNVNETDHAESIPLSSEFQKLQIQRHTFQPIMKSMPHKRARKNSPYSLHRHIERIDSNDIEYPPSETDRDCTLLSL